MTNRKLNLRRETLSALTSDDLHSVAGAASGYSCGGTCIELRCHVAIAYSVKPTCQDSICYCPTY